MTSPQRSPQPYVASSQSADVSADVQDRIQAIKLPPVMQEPANVQFPIHMQQRVEDIAIPPALGVKTLDKSDAANQHLDLESKVQLTGRGQTGGAKEEAAAVARD